MKKIFTLFAASAATVSLNAQISISQSDFSSWKPGKDSGQEVFFKVPLATNGNWDLTTETFDIADTSSFSYEAFTDAALPGATYSYLSGYSFSATGYDANIAGGINASGVVELGQSIPLQQIDISMLTGRTGDLLTFPKQVIPYSAPRKRLSFPMTMGTKWTSGFNYSTNFVLHYNSVDYAGYRKTYTAQKDSVGGWGRMRIKRLDGSNSGWMNVLGVQTRTYTTDSFFLPGYPSQVLDALLGGFRLKQGMRDSSYYVQFMRKGEIEPLYVVGYDDSTYSARDYAYVHQSRILGSLGVNNLPSAAGIKLFPNPATATGGFDIELTETAAGAWSYSLLDASGKVVSSSTIAPSSSKAHINAAQAAPGTYFLNLQNNGQQVATKPVLIK
jgi:hypothetical protein